MEIPPCAINARGTTVEELYGARVALQQKGDTDTA